MAIPITDGILYIFHIFLYILYISLAICFVFKIIKHKKHSGDTTAFLYHFIANTVFDIFHNVSIIVFLKFLHWKIFLEYFLNSTLIKRAYGPIIYISIVGVILGHLIIVINIYCAINHCTTFKIFWTKKVCLKLIFLQYFLPTAIFSYNFFYEAEVAYVTSFDFYVFIITDEWVNLMNNSILLVTSVISAVITFTLNVVTLRKYSKVINKKKGNERSKLFLMFLYMAITTMCLILFAIERLIGLYFRIVKNKEGGYFLTFTLYWILPILTLTQPVTTLIMSKSLRKFFLSFYFKRFLPRNNQISSNFNLKTGAGMTKKTQT